MSSDHLERRLRTDEAMIEACTDETERERLEDFWLKLLGEYESAVDLERIKPINEAVTILRRRVAS